MREVEAVLYGNGFAEQTGAVYRLLKRSGVQGRTLARTRTQAPANLCPILNLPILPTPTTLTALP